MRPSRASLWRPNCEVASRRCSWFKDRLSCLVAGIRPAGSKELVALAWLLRGVQGTLSGIVGQSATGSWTPRRRMCATVRSGLVGGLGRASLDQRTKVLTSHYRQRLDAQPNALTHD